MTSPIETQADDLVLRWQDLRRRHGGLGNGEFRAHHAGFADEVLDELLLRWQEERDAGGDPVERLCGSCPELADELRQRIAAIEAMEDRFGMEPTAPSESLPPTQPGTAADGNGTVHVPGFETLGELGHGGMGVVYKARQLKPSRLVALKMLLSGRYARPADRARFDSEVEALADLQHPNIVPIYQVGEVDGLPYFAMEYVEGGSLAQRLQGQPLPQREAAALVETLARAMHVAHTHGIIHRDLKPANVLLCHPSPQPPPRNGEGEQDPPPFPRREGGLGGLGDAIPKITDFGLAKRLNRERDLTPSHAIVGTVCYMAPEQAAGNIRAVGTPADIYALGGILYEALTGRPPIQADSDIDALRQLLHQEPTSPRRLSSDIDRNLETICLKCLHKDPAQRYHSAAALADDLRRFLDGEPIAARPARVWERLAKWVRRRPALAGLAVTGAVAVVALVGVIVSLFYSGRLASANDQLNGALAQLGSTNNQLNVALSQAGQEKERGDHYLYIARTKLAHRAWLDGNLRLLRELLDSQKPKPGRPDPRGFEWHYLDTLSGKSGTVLAEHPGGAHALALSADGKRLASCGADGKVLVWETANLKAPPRSFQSPEDSGPALCLALDWNGSRLATGHRDGTINLWTAASGTKLHTLRGHGARVYSLAFSPSGKRLVTTDEGNALNVWDLTGAAPVLLRSSSDAPFCSIAFLPNSERFLVAGGDYRASRSFKKEAMKVRQPGKPTGGGTIRSWDAADGKELPSPALTLPRLIHSVAIAPNGRRFATGGYDHKVRIWDRASGKDTPTQRDHNVEVLSVAFSPDGERVASASWDKTVRVWDAATGAELHVFRGHTDVVRAVVYGKDGLLISASADGTVQLWRADQDQTALVREEHHPGGVRALATGADDLVVSGGQDGLLKLWDACRRKVLAVVPAPGPVLAVALARDGKAVICGTEQGTVSLWKVAATNTLDRWPLWTWSNDNRPVLSLALSPDGRTVACVVGRQEITEGKKGQMIQQAGGRPQDVGEVILLDAATGKEKGRLVGHTAEVYSVAFSPDGRRLATAGAAWEDASQRRHGEIKLWHAKTYKEEASLRGHGAPVLSIAFSPDGALLASGGFDYTVKLWSLADGKEIHTLPGHVCLVHSVAFSPDGKRLASGSEDWTVKVWDVQLGAETLDLRGHWDRVQAVAFSPEGDRLFSGSEDGSLRVWEAPRQR